LSDPDESVGHGPTGHVPTGAPVTGDDVVDEAVALLTDLDAVPVTDRPEIFDAVHRALQDRLADVEG